MKYFMVDVPACNMQAIEKIIARLAKKGIKARLDVMRETVKTVPVKRITADRKVENTGIKEPVSIVDFELTVENASLGKWELLGTKERLGDGVIYRGNIPEEYRNANFECQHCSTHRRRNKVAVIRHIDNGETKQVGYTCLSDFIGRELGAFGALIKGLDEIVEHENYYGGFRYKSGKCWYYHVGQYLQIAYNCIVKYGYVKPNNDYYDDEISTLERISTAYSDKTDEYVDPEKVDTDLIDKIKQAFYDFASHPSNFTHNVCAVLQCTRVNPKYTKLLYFVPTFYLNKVKWEARKQEAEAKKQAFIATLNNEYAGSVGDKITTEATLTRYSTFDGDYGIMYVYNFKDVHGHVLVWFTSKALTAVNEGDTITIKGTVKKLSEYKGIKQTILTRCKVKFL